MKSIKKTVKLTDAAKQKKSEPSVPALSEYNGKPMLCLNPESKWSFQFGLGKARMIVEHIDAIAAFVDSEGKSLE